MIQNYLTVDVEDYFQVSAFEGVIRPEQWGTFTPRVVENTRRILDLLDEHQVKATFFVLGWTAAAFPELVKEIDGRGHEIACHSYYHRLIYNLTPAQFREDTRQARDVLQQITGKPVRGYRAPSYSITNRSYWALEILAGLGFEFDSSIFPIYHDRYGIPGAPRFRHKIQGHNLFEYPISTARLGRFNVPAAGGGYFRIFPYCITRRCLASINIQEQQPFVFYLHPWELDPEQPRVNKTGILSRFRHYINLDKTAERFRRLLSDFEFIPVHG